eukprot:GCRY01001594.1.p1 GENE.GCRY01001594.1~~GCRY01001594.1.p1  ORF type:complete len:419 (-),score=35.65 GCRY01001594.1:433-1689(-)
MGKKKKSNGAIATGAKPKESEEIAKKPNMFFTLNFWRRFISATVLIAFFVSAVYFDHWYVAGIVFASQITMYYEVIRIGYHWNEEKKIPGFRFISWFWAFVMFYFVYGKKLLCQKAVRAVLGSSLYSILDRFHYPITFTLYCCGIVTFVMLLRKGLYRYQFGQLAWAHMALLVVVGMTYVIVNNIFTGLVWFIIPVSLVIINDIFAYLVGKLIGRTLLIKLSPKKTWEGFIGGLVFTMIAAWFLSGFLSQFSWFICPQQELMSTNDLSCQVSEVFKPALYDINSEFRDSLNQMLGYLGFDFLLPETVEVLPIQLHSLVFGAFASIIGPFGGFFASGLKRAYNLKDFGDSIPGHGGVTDRMDCQILMGIFTYVYVQAFVETATVTGALEHILALSEDAQLELLNRFQLSLFERGLIQNM